MWTLLSMSMSGWFIIWCKSFFRSSMHLEILALDSLQCFLAMSVTSCLYTFHRVWGLAISLFVFSFSILLRSFCTFMPLFSSSLIRSLFSSAGSCSIHLPFLMYGASAGVNLVMTSQWSVGTAVWQDFQSKVCFAAVLDV